MGRTGMGTEEKEAHGVDFCKLIGLIIIGRCEIRGGWRKVFKVRATAAPSRCLRKVCLHYFLSISDSCSRLA